MLLLGEIGLYERSCKHFPACVLSDDTLLDAAFTIRENCKSAWGCVWNSTSDWVDYEHRRSPSGVHHHALRQFWKCPTAGLCFKRYSPMSQTSGIFKNIGQIRLWHRTPTGLNGARKVFGIAGLKQRADRYLIILQHPKDAFPANASFAESHSVIAFRAS